MRWPGAFGLAVALSLSAANAQDQAEVRSPILVINQERIFAESSVGARAAETYEAAARELAAENDRIEADLTEQERALTEERASLDPEAFREKADAFDARVQRIRAEQDQKARALQARREEARRSFFQDAGGAIRDISRERGALVVLDQRNVVLSADAIDITDEVIGRLNEIAEDGETSEP